MDRKRTGIPPAKNTYFRPIFSYKAVNVIVIKAVK
jgi:hypothetical protein